MLSVEHVTKRYGAFTALEDISLTFTPGVYGLLGPNGAGKTTLMKMLATLLFPTKGQILWDGEDILALGAGGISKRIYPDQGRIEREPNVSNIEQYIARVDEMVARKERLFLGAGPAGHGEDGDGIA